jgi:hypothetical protein
MNEKRICIEVEYSPYETIFKYNGLIIKSIKETLDNQQQLSINLLPNDTEKEMNLIRPASIQRITIEKKHSPNMI